MKRIYLDNNATTALAPEVIALLQNELDGTPSNPSSVHYFGQKAKQKLIEARHRIADYFRVAPTQVLFTSGGTESINTAIHSIATNNPNAHFISTETEHAATYESLKALEKKGHKISFLDVNQQGHFSISALKEAIEENTGAIVLSSVNSETGVKIDLSAISTIAERENIPLIIDAVAQLGKEPVVLPCKKSFLCFSGHKIHAPKGTGFCIVSKDFPFTPLLFGGPQQYQRRAGTENVSGICALAKAIDLIDANLPKAQIHMQNLLDRLENGLKDAIDEIVIHGGQERVCNVTNIAFPGIDGELLMMQLDLSHIAVSQGSACAAGAIEPSRVLRTMGIAREIARSSIRFSLSRYTTVEEIDRCIATISKLVKQQTTMCES